MTATTRVGFHQYTFLNPGRCCSRYRQGDAHIILDLMHGIYNYDGKNVWTYARIVDDHTVVGYRQTNGWARTRTVYFAMEFSKPFTSYGYKDFAPLPYKGFWRKFDQSKNFPKWPGSRFAHISISKPPRMKRSRSNLLSRRFRPTGQFQI